MVYYVDVYLLKQVIIRSVTKVGNSQLTLRIF